MNCWWLGILAPGPINISPACLITSGINPFNTPAKTPQQTIQFLYKNVVAALADADLRERLEKEGSELLGSSPKEFGAHIVNEVQMWGRVIREAGIQAN